MAIDFSVAYETPISLDAARMIGTHEARPAIWRFLAMLVAGIVIIGNVSLAYPPLAHWTPSGTPTLFLWLIPVAIVWALICHICGATFHQRHIEYWLRAWVRHLRLPRVLQERSLEKYHAIYRVDGHKLVSVHGASGGVIEVGTVNLLLRDSATLATFIKQLHMFYLGLKWPVQIVVRATLNEQIERRWFIAVTADSDESLEVRLNEIVSGLARAGLTGRPLNGDLFASLQECWTKTPGSTLGPSSVQRERTYVKVGGEYVRGFLLSKWPRTIEPNWLAPFIDGDQVVDFSMWLDPIDNADEAQVLSSRASEWEAAQILNVNKTGFRDPDIDESIRDAKVTRLLLRQRKIRVFRGSVGFVVRGRKLDQMRTRERVLLAQLREYVGDDAVVPLDYEQDRAPLLAVPTGEPPIQYPLQIISPAAALTYPFSNSCLRMRDGVDCGLSIGSHRINKLNVFGLANPHTIVLGTSGAGKGYWVKVYLWRILHGAQRVDVRIIQTEKDEYTALAEAMGKDGIIVRLDALDEIESKLRQPGNSYNIMRQFGPLIVFDLTHMTETERGKAIAVLLGYLERTETWFKPNNTLCVIDELGIILRDKDAALAIDTAYRRFRSIPSYDNPRDVSRIGMIGMTQLPSDLLGKEHGKVLAALAETHLYLRQKATELRVTKSILDLSPDEASFIETAGTGDALLVAGLTRVAIHLDAKPHEHEFART